MATAYDDGNVPSMETKAKRPLSSDVTMKEDVTLHSSMQKASKTTTNVNAVLSFLVTNNAVSSLQKKYMTGISSAIAAMMADGGTLPLVVYLDSSSVKDVAIPTLSTRYTDIQLSSKKEIHHLSSYHTMTKDGTVLVPVTETEVKDLSPSRQLVKRNIMVPFSEGKLTLSPSSKQQRYIAIVGEKGEVPIFPPPRSNERQHGAIVGTQTRQINLNR